MVYCKILFIEEEGLCDMCDNENKSSSACIDTFGSGSSNLNICQNCLKKILKQMKN